MSKPDTDILASSPFDGDLDEELAARPERRPISKLTLGLAAGLLLIAGALGGIQAQKLWGSDVAGPGLMVQPAGENQRPGQAGTQGRSSTGRPGATGGLTTGTVKRVAGKKIYLETMDGTAVTVTTNGQTRIQVTEQGKVADLKPGSTVLVQGEKGGDGTVAATMVSQGGGFGVRGGR
ncbi:hypothetical protein [Streptosporangium sp. KLBMP 9127]|nr:hypothetical protein [Streptosporangium sp. KLBMP 9127]